MNMSWMAVRVHLKCANRCNGRGGRFKHFSRMCHRCSGIRQIQVNGELFRIKTLKWNRNNGTNTVICVKIHKRNLSKTSSTEDKQ